MNLKKLKWPFYVFTFLLITLVATILQGLKGKTIPQVSDAIILVGLFYAVVYGVFRVVSRVVSKKEASKHASDAVNDINSHIQEPEKDDKKGNKPKRKRAGEMVILLIIVFLAGFILGHLYTKHQKTDPTYYECLQLGSDWARKECIDKYDLEEKLPTHEEIMNFQRGKSIYDSLIAPQD